VDSFEAQVKITIEKSISPLFYGHSFIEVQVWLFFYSPHLGFDFSNAFDSWRWMLWI
jgi:hypothetical protein